MTCHTSDLMEAGIPKRPPRSRPSLPLIAQMWGTRIEKMLVCLEEEMKSLGLLDAHFGRRADGGVDSVDLQGALRFPPCIARSMRRRILV